MAQMCKLCGQPMPGGIPGLVIDDDRGEVRFAGQSFHVPRTKMRLLGALAAKPGRCVTKEQLSHAMYYDRRGSDTPDDKIIDVFVCHLRKLFAGVGLEIKTHWARGYELVAPGLTSLETGPGPMVAEVREAMS